MGGCLSGHALSTLKLPSPPSSDLQKAAHEGISLGQFCKVFLILILQIGKLPRELKTLASGHTADKWLHEMPDAGPEFRLGHQLGH